MRLQVFENRCASCRVSWRTAHFTGADQSLVEFAAPDGSTTFAEPDNDPVWGEVGALVDDLISQRGLDTSPQDRATLFLAAFERTLDSSGDLVPRAWGSPMRCPACGADLLSTYWGPVDPPEFIDVDPILVTHESWRSRSEIEKRNLVSDAMDLTLMTW